MPLRELVRFVGLLLAVLGMLCVHPAQAQTGDGGPYWYSPSGGGLGPFPTARDACYAQWQRWGSSGRFIGDVTYDENNFTVRGCRWITSQWPYLGYCGQEGLSCNTILPSLVYLSCASGYTPTVDGHCRKDPPPECPKCSKGRTNPGVGNPILLSTGAKAIDAQDYEAADGLFRIGRHYRSFQVGLSLDGNALPKSTPRWMAGGWNFNFGYEIQLKNFSGTPSSPSAKVAILAPDGTGYAFVLQSSGAWVPDPAGGAARAQPDMTLEFVGTLPSNLADINTSANSWKLTDGDDNVWILRTAVGPNGGNYNWGWPISKTARDGYAWTFAYHSDSSLASITDSFGRAATFTWNKFYSSTLSSPPAGMLPYPVAVSSIALPDGTSLRYSYDPTPASGPSSGSIAIRRLIKAERLSATSAVIDSETYLYEDARFPTHVTGIVDNLGNRVRTYAYDGDGRAISTQGANGIDAYSVAFGVSGTTLTRQVTNPLGKTSTYSYSKFTAGSADYRLTGIAGAASANTPASSNSISYGTDTFIANGTDDEGRTTTSTRDSRGNPTSIVEASGTADARTTTTTWHSTLNVPTSIVRPGLTETRSYNSIGQLISVTQTDTTSQSVPYSTNGQTRTWTYDWTSSGRLLSINGPLAASGSQDDITSFTYDTSGNRLTMTNSLGQVTSYGSYDANGRPGTMTDANGIVTAFAYDAMGRVTTITVKHPSTSSLDAVTAIGYDAVGQVTGITLPSTDQLIMDYNAAGQLTSMRAASGERRDYSYDAMGNVTAETVKRTDGTISRRISRTFDELGRMLTQTLEPRRTSRMAYDKVGNTTGVTTPNGNATSQAFDALDRLVSTVAPDSGAVAQGYDARDNLTSNTDPKSVTTQFVYNGFGGVIQEVSPDRGTSTHWYDAAGALIKSVDGRGQEVVYTRDWLGRVTSKVPTGLSGEAVAYTWDTGGLSGSYDVGRIGAISDGSGTTQFQYDHRGNLLVQQQGVGTTSAAQLSYAYDLADRVTQVTYPSGRIVAYTYDGKGRVSQVETKASSSVGTWTVLANGYAYEPFGPVKAMTLGNGLSMANDWGNDGRLASRRLYRTSGGTNLSYLSYGYDPNDNIQAIRDQLNDTNSLYYGYDANDRLKQTSLVAGSPTTGTESYSYTSGTNRLSSVTNVSGTRSITYDGRGNTASESQPGSVSATTSYDGYGRLTGYARTDVGSLSFAYNGQDDRVAMTSGTGPRRFVYDTDGRVLGEYGASASDVKAEFIWALPQLANDNEFGGDDGVGGYAPLAVATPDSGGTVQLNWVHGNHLGVPIVTTDASGNAATTPNDYLAPGFPGQSRVIADLYYNRYRDYDPGTGRYIQADPIGLEGGSNPYLYANANPIRYTDPSGLDPVGGAIGGVIGGWAGGAVGALAGPEGIPIGAMAGRWGGRIIGSAIGDACIAAGNDDDRDPQCHKASKYELRQAGIYDEHEYKIEHGARPPSRFDICKCRDGSIRIAPVGQCGKTRNFW
jgi:RHS repeat-associated protein